MANNVIKRIWNQNKLVNIESLHGMTFQAEKGGHTFRISGIDDTGAAVSLSGTVGGVFRRSDNADIALIGSSIDGVASVTLTEDCYAVPGRFGLTIFVISGGQKTAVYACIGTVANTTGGAVAGETPQDVVDLINAISAAVATIPPSYTALMAAIAPTYSDQAVYPAGSYRWHGGVLYKNPNPIITPETWTAAHWTQATLASDVADLKNAIDKFKKEGYVTISGFGDFETSANFTSYVTYVFPTVYNADKTINKIRFMARNRGNATESLKLLTCHTDQSGKVLVDSVSSAISFTFTVSAGSFEEISIVLDTPFVIGNGYQFAISLSYQWSVLANVGVEEGSVCVGNARVTVYETLAVGDRLITSPNYNQRLCFIAYEYESYIPEYYDADETDAAIDDACASAKEEAIDSSKTYTDTQISAQTKKIDMLDNMQFRIDGVLHTVEKGYYYHGEKLSNDKRVRLSNPVFIEKGVVLTSGLYQMYIDRLDNSGNYVEQEASDTTSHTISQSAFYEIFFISLLDIESAQADSGTTLFVPEDIERYGLAELSSIDYTATQYNETVLSDMTHQTMAHVAMISTDTYLNDGTMWVTYYANDDTTEEGADDVRTYLCVDKYNVITKQLTHCATFHVGDTIGNFTLVNTPPYDPIPVVFENYVLIMFIGNDGTERCLGCFRMDKTTYAFSNYNDLIISYNGVNYTIIGSNIRTIYSSITGETVSTITNLGISTHPVLVNGYYFAAVNDVFENSGYRPLLIKSTDLIHWTVVHAFTHSEIVYNTVETSLEYWNSKLVICARTGGGINYMAVYDIANDTVEGVYEIPFSKQIKPCVKAFRGRLFIFDTIRDTYSTDGARNNLGIFEVDSNWGIKLIAKILTDTGMHYPDVAFYKNLLFMAWSENKRMLNTLSQRTNVAIANIKV